MVLHMAKDCLHRRKNFRHYHCFGDEDGMKHLKCTLVNFAVMCIVSSDFQSLIPSISRIYLSWSLISGIARAAHPLRRSRWIMYMMRLRLISMKTKIKTLLVIYDVPTVALLWCWLYALWNSCDLFLNVFDKLRLNRSVKQRRGWERKTCKKEWNWWPKLFVSNNGLSQTIAFDSNDHKINSLWMARVSTKTLLNHCCIKTFFTGGARIDSYDAPFSWSELLRYWLHPSQLNTAV